MDKLLVASSNAGKLKEFQELLHGVPVVWVMLKDIGLADMDVEETGETFEANALLKARAYCTASGLPTLADDSGIVVDALNGAPGVYSARYAPTVEARNTNLLNALEGVPHNLRTARFVSVIALVTPDNITVTAEGRVEGHVATAPRGENGFGYDPVFILEDGRGFAELSIDQKNAISHRGRALAKLEPIVRCMFA